MKAVMRITMTMAEVKAVLASAFRDAGFEVQPQHVEIQEDESVVATYDAPKEPRK